MRSALKIDPRRRSGADMERSTRPVVEIARLSKSFGNGPTAVHALVDIDLTINTGEVVGLIGPSGSGKSTLLNCIGCITEPDAGQSASMVARSIAIAG